MIRFTVEGNPVPKQSFKVGGNGHGYQPERVIAWEQAVAWAAAIAMTGKPPMTCQLAATFDFYVEDRRRKDCENLAKSVNDGLMMGGLMQDDSQVVDLHLRKHYVKRGEGRVEIEVTPMETA